MNIPIRQTNGLAITSLVAALLGWSFVPIIGSVVAIVTGHLARGEIRRQPERYDGNGLAVSGLILGYLPFILGALAILVFVLFFGGLAWWTNIQ